MVRASGESGHPCSDEVSSTHHSDSSMCPNSKDDLRDRDWKMNPDLESSPIKAEPMP